VVPRAPKWAQLVAIRFLLALVRDHQAAAAAAVQRSVSFISEER